MLSQENQNKPVFYLGNSNLKASGTKINWEPWMIEELVRCENDIIYFAEKYMKIVHPDDGFVTIELYDYQKELIQKIKDNRMALTLQCRQSGKALSLDTPIPMADGGFKLMGDISVGDRVLGNDGKPATVTFVSEIHNKPTYEITFSDGSKVKACEDHLWEVKDSWNNNKTLVLDTKTIEKRYRRFSQKKKPDGSPRTVQENRYYIPNTKPVQYPKRKLECDPYVLGAWLGDGHSAARFTCGISDKQEYVDNGISFLSELSHARKSRPNIWTNTISGLHVALRHYGIIDNKDIPDDFLYSSIEDRLALVQGLMDTDGTIDSDGSSVVFAQSKDRESLVLKLKQVLESLGFVVRLFTKRNKVYDRDYLYLEFTANVEMPPFRLKRKLERLRQTTRNSTRSRRIVNVELIATEPTQCISVDNVNHIFLCGKEYIPTHNTTVATIVIIHYILFNKHKSVGILANKRDTSIEILSRIQLAYEALPNWMQQGVITWNKGSIELENGCKVLAAATSSSSVRGKSFQLIYIDETAFIPEDDWNSFFTSTFPTITAGKTTKIFMSSTPNGLNHWYRFCKGAKEKTNGYAYHEVLWRDVPGRDEKWKEEVLAGMNYDYQKFNQEYECEFLGSSGTLISGETLKQLIPIQPLKETTTTKVYEFPADDRSYTMVCDVSRGKGLDYSAFSVFDITEMPYRQVCTFRDNLITPVEYAETIFMVHKNYNDASILVEINDIGGQVADLLHMEYEVENLLYTENHGRSGKRISGGFGSKADRGIRTTKTVKATGCSILKLLVEQNQLKVVDSETIKEINSFSRKGTSYEAESGKNDDLVMGLVLFAWLTDQDYFKLETDINTLAKLREKTEEELAEDMLPIGFNNLSDDEDQIAAPVVYHFNGW